MSSSTTNLWGQDIALDTSGQALVSASGELILTSGPQTGVQDIALRLLTPLGSLFYDADFGSLLHEWIYEESTPVSRAGLVAELVMRVELDPRVMPHSINSAILKWDEKSITVSLNWQFIDEDQPYNLVMQINKEIRDIIVADAKPDSDNLSAHIQGD